MFVTLFGLTSDEGRDAPDASSERRVVDVKASVRADDCRPRRHPSIAIRRECNSLLQAADEAVFGDHAEFYRENSNDWFDG